LSFFTATALLSGCGDKAKEASAPTTPAAQAPPPPGPATTTGLTPEQRAVIEKADAQGPAINAANSAVAPTGK